MTLSSDVIIKEMKILKVPHIKQTAETTCGAAALSMIYQFYGLKMETEAKIWDRLKEPRHLNPSEEFIQTSKLAEDAKKNGFYYIIGQAVWNNLEKSVALLEEFLRIEAPIIVCQKFTKDSVIGHFRIVMGIEDDSIILNDPSSEEEFSVMSKSDFFEMWQKCSDEVIGGQFVAILDSKQAKQLGSIPLFWFSADVTDFEVSNLNFSK